MISANPKAIIELGNLNIKCLIFVLNNNIPEILSYEIVKSEGIHNGTITNFSKALKTIRSCISYAEKKSGVLIKKSNVVLEQPEFLCTKFSKHRKINGVQIDKDDIEFLLQEAKKEANINDDRQSIIHIFNHSYIVDGKTFIEEPIDIYANSLRHEMTFVTMPKNNIKNINQVFIECEIEIERYISSTFALAVKLLNNNDLNLGSALIDIGFEKISLGIFKNLALVHSITLPVGVNHITKDISKVCSLTLEESEIIKDKIDFSFNSFNELFSDNGYLKDIYFITSNFRKISKSLIVNVVKARLDEIFEIIKKEIFTTESNLTFKTSIFITGGGSNLINLDSYSSKFFGKNIKKVYKASNNQFEKNFTACLGALKIITEGWETEAIPEPVNKNTLKIGFFSRMFGN
jgi:cell division protein FtsA